MIDKYIAARKGRWDRLAYLLSGVKGRRASDLTAAELEQFGQLYRETASDLALARREFPRAPVVVYLNSLLAQAHPYVYAEREDSRRSAVRFFAHEFPATFRRNGSLVLLSFLSFILPALLAYSLSMVSPEAAAVLAPEGMRDRVEDVQRTGRWADISASESSFAASTIMTNNIRVAIVAFAGGILLGLPTLLVLAFNGLFLGAVVAVAQQGGVGMELWSFVSPHGWIELTVIFIAGGAGLAIGRSEVLPGLLSRRDALVAATADAVKLLLGGAALLVLAGTIEGFISPSSIPAWFKFLFGFLTGVALYSYLLTAGRRAVDGRRERVAIG